MDCQSKAEDERNIGSWERWGDEMEDARSVEEKKEGRIRERKERQRNGEMRGGRRILV